MRFSTSQTPSAQQPEGTPPIIKPTTLHVLMAFDRNDEGDLVPALEPMQMPSAHSAVMRAKLLQHQYAGVLAWSRAARPDQGEYGEPEELYRHGDVPDME